VNLLENELYNLKTDPSETVNIINEFPVIAKKIIALADGKRKEIGDDLTNVIGIENREVGMID
jgi:arylsulfatase